MTHAPTAARCGVRACDCTWEGASSVRGALHQAAAVAPAKPERASAGKHRPCSVTATPRCAADARCCPLAPGPLCAGPAAPLPHRAAGLAAWRWAAPAAPGRCGQPRIGAAGRRHPAQQQQAGEGATAGVVSALLVSWQLPCTAGRSHRAGEDCRTSRATRGTSGSASASVSSSDSRPSRGASRCSTRAPTDARAAGGMASTCSSSSAGCRSAAGVAVAIARHRPPPPPVTAGGAALAPRQHRIWAVRSKECRRVCTRREGASKARVQNCVQARCGRCCCR